MCSNILASPAYGVYISQLIRYARASSNYSDLYTFSLYENPSFIIVSAETKYILTRSWYRNILDLTTVVNSVLKFMINGTTSILKS
jgi:hypothetical protein